MGMLAAIAVAAPALLAGDKDFFNLPDAYEFRTQKIWRTDRERDWPFSVDTGILACVWGLGQRLTYFVEEVEQDELSDVETTPRLLVLTTNPFDLVFLNLGSQALFNAGQTIEQRIQQVAPFVTIALKLCDQPPGSSIGPAEL